MKTISQSLISAIDLSATCLELVRIENPECIQGRSFMPISKDPEATLREGGLCRAPMAWV